MFIKHKSVFTNTNCFNERAIFSICYKHGLSTTKDITGWAENDRGVSFVFGPDVVSSFLRKHDLDLICRAHQVVEDGYEFFAKRQLITLFSAPNYCGEFDNAGAMMTIDESLMLRWDCPLQGHIPRLLKNRSQGLPGGCSKNAEKSVWGLPQRGLLKVFKN